MKKLSNPARPKKWKPQSSWNTTDDYEIELRRQRVEAEPMMVTPLSAEKTVFKNYTVHRHDQEHNQKYLVELRSLTENINTCSCPDFAKNFLGTCKHIEKVKSIFPDSSPAASARIEIYMERSPWVPVIRFPGRGVIPPFFHRYLKINGRFKEPVANTLLALLRDLKTADPHLEKSVRVSAEIPFFLQQENQKRLLAHWGQEYASRLQASNAQIPELRHPLYDYQIAGTLHLAFTGRALLADEMGLGKTVQAIAAAILQKECFNIRRVLVVAPASLKCEWEDQIRMFTSMPAELLYGLRPKRLETYRKTTAFFLVANYEQVLRDVDDINDLFHPDLVILDEAQRIKNWRTRTASNLKRLQSRFAFILTGTPLENRIDELYSLVEFVDPTLLGSLFRFNRRFYKFDADGKTIGMKNLRELHDLVKPVMLRRRKDEIDEQLPERIDNNYFVKLTEEQKKRYGDYFQIVTHLASKARRYALTPEEFKRLQKCLACMRMLCDAVYILDQTITDSPKIGEMMRILADIWENSPETKIVVFSEWTRMLELLEKALDDNGIPYAIHTGAINQQKRREEIRRFKKSPDCRILLSSDSGSVGLNLQIASAVINLDLPWNPARHEQRIARAWRKHQRNRVQVINLVAENSIEQRMLGTLDYKKGLSDAVLDGRGDYQVFESEDSRSAFLERLGQIMATPLVTDATAAVVEALPAATPLELLSEELRLDDGGASLCQAACDGESGKVRAILAVAPPARAAAISEKIAKALPAEGVAGKTAIISPQEYALLQKLAQMGVISINPELQTAFAAATATEARPSETALRLKRSAPFLTEAGRQLKMANVLRGSGFAGESVRPAAQAILKTGLALFLHCVETLPAEDPAAFSPDMLKTLQATNPVPRELLLYLPLCLNSLDSLDDSLADTAEQFLTAANEFCSRQAISP